MTSEKRRQKYIKERLRKAYREGALTEEQKHRVEALGIAPRTNSWVSKYPDIAAEWHPTKNGDLSPEDVTAGSDKKVWWLGKCGHEWHRRINNNIRSDGTCPFCINRKVLPGFNDLATTNPDVAVMWHPIRNGGLTPSEVLAGSEKKVWWRCDKGHEWERRIDRMVESGQKCHQCPHCLTTNLVTTNPDVAAEWHPTKNGDLKPTDVTAGVSKKVWWLGKCGHEWEAAIYSRARGIGCPFCSNRKVLPGFNDLATTNPDLAAEWHPTKNGDLKPSDVLAGSNKKVWWLGKCGHEWEAVVSYRSRRGNGCLICAKESSGCKVINVEKDECFSSIRAAARAYSIEGRKENLSNIQRALKDPTRTAYGYHWKYVE